MAIQAVLTGDIVHSTSLGATREKKLLRILNQVLKDHKYEFYRGDSFQAFLKNAGKALQIALLCRTAAIRISDEQSPEPSDTRISIGIGKAKNPIKKLGASSGAPYIFSGRAFDEMVKIDTRLAITSDNQLANIGLQVIADYINSIFDSMTCKQAEVIFELLNGKNQLAVAGRLRKSKSTIHQHASAGRWNEIETLLKQYEHIINQLS